MTRWPGRAGAVDRAARTDRDVRTRGLRAGDAAAATRRGKAPAAVGALRRVGGAVPRRVPRYMSRSQAVVRATGALVMVAAAIALGGPGVVLVLCMAAAVAAALAPESAAAPLSAGALVLLWIAGLHATDSPGALGLALAILVQHTCHVIASAGPARAAVPGRLVVRAAARAAVVGVATALVWVLLALAPAGTGAPGWAVAAAVVALGVAAVALGWPTAWGGLRRRRSSGH